MPIAPGPRLTLHVPFRFVQRGGRKEMQVPPGARPSRGADSTLVRAVARAFRWQRMLETAPTDRR
jgi:hypothetical protein